MSALLLEPHQDDAALFAAFLCLRHRPRVITVLHGDRMADPNYPGGPVAHSTRVLETQAAMSVLRLQWEQWHFSDLDPDTDALADRIAALECDLLIAPAVEAGGHEDHNLVGSLAQIVGCELIQYLTYTRAGGRSTGGAEVSFEPGWPVLKLRALACYESQIQHPATAAHFLGGLREYVL